MTATEPVPERDPALQRLLDRGELSELLAELSSAVDRQDHDRIVACYAEESFDDHGGFGGSGREFATYVTTPRSGQDARPPMHHLLGQSVFDIQGDEAWGETFFLFHGFTETSLAPAVGRYVDYFSRVDGMWKLVYRRVVIDWVGTYAATRSPSIDTYAQAARDRTDPSYDRLRWPKG